MLTNLFLITLPIIYAKSLNTLIESNQTNTNYEISKLGKKFVLKKVCYLDFNSR